MRRFGLVSKRLISWGFWLLIGALLLPMLLYGIFEDFLNWRERKRRDEMED